MEIKIECPLGSKCEYIGDDKIIHRCAWYTEVIGKNPQTLQDINEWKCAIAWMPILEVEVSRTNRGQTAAIESFRNESVNQQTNFNLILSSAIQRKQQIEGK